jgi:RNA polymerase sigma factor (sigma-70 family)
MEPNQKIQTDTEIIDMLLDHRTTTEAITYLYREHFEALGRFIMNNSGNWEDAQDIFQEVMISFVQLVQQNKFRKESSIKTILFSMNRNLWFNELKRRDKAQKRERKYESGSENMVDDAGVQIDNRENSVQLLKIMDLLGEKCKQLLVLFYFENLGINELQNELEYENEQVVRNKKYKCLKKLEELISGDQNLYNKIKMLLHG